MFLVDVLTSLSVSYKGFKGTYENLEYEGWMPTPNHQNEEWIIRERLHDWYGVALSKDKKTLALSMTMGDGGVGGQFVMILTSQKATLYRFESGDSRAKRLWWRHSMIGHQNMCGRPRWSSTAGCGKPYDLWWGSVVRGAIPSG
jgi:hypothetical protein